MTVVYGIIFKSFVSFHVPAMGCVGRFNLGRPSVRANEKTLIGYRTIDSNKLYSFSSVLSWAFSVILVFLNKRYTHNMSSYQDVHLSVHPSVRKCCDKCRKEGTSVSYCHIFESYNKKVSSILSYLVGEGLQM